MIESQQQSNHDALFGEGRHLYLQDGNNTSPISSKSWSKRIQNRIKPSKKKRFNAENEEYRNNEDLQSNQTSQKLNSFVQYITDASAAFEGYFEEDYQNNDNEDRGNNNYLPKSSRSSTSRNNDYNINKKNTLPENSLFSYSGPIEICKSPQQTPTKTERRDELNSEIQQSSQQTIAFETTNNLIEFSMSSCADNLNEPGADSTSDNWNGLDGLSFDYSPPRDMNKISTLPSPPKMATKRSLQQNLENVDYFSGQYQSTDGSRLSTFMKPSPRQIIYSKQLGRKRKRVKRVKTGPTVIVPLQTIAEVESEDDRSTFTVDDTISYDSTSINQSTISINSEGSLSSSSGSMLPDPIYSSHPNGYTKKIIRFRKTIPRPLKIAIFAALAVSIFAALWLRFDRPIDIKSSFDQNLNSVDDSLINTLPEHISQNSTNIHPHRKSTAPSKAPVHQSKLSNNASYPFSTVVTSNQGNIPVSTPAPFMSMFYPISTSSSHPTIHPSTRPIVSPTSYPTLQATNIPSDSVTTLEFKVPSSYPTESPSYLLTQSPTYLLTQSPTINLLLNPTKKPSSIPTVSLSTPKPSYGTKNPVVFYVLPEIAYDFRAKIHLYNQIDGVPKDANFIVHMSAFNSNVTFCPEQVYRTVKNTIQSATKTPVFLLPSDNDYSDCENTAEAWAYWIKYWGHFDEYWDHPLQVKRQNSRPENFAFFVNEFVLFIGVHIISGNKMKALDHELLMIDNIEWAMKNINEFKNRGLNVVVIFGHTSAHEVHDSFFKTLGEVAEDLNLPILYVHGDSSTWMIQKDSRMLYNITDVNVKSGSSRMLKMTARNDSDDPIQFNFV